MNTLFLSLFLALTPLDSQVGITTTDGKVISGILASRQLEMETDFGAATLQSDAIISITLGETDVVTTAGDSVLRGKIKLDSLTLKTASGSRTISRAKIQSLNASQPAELVAGKITSGLHWNQSTYHLRAPKDYDPSQPWPAMVFLHGSGSNTEMFLRAISARWPDIGETYVLIGVNGTLPADHSTPERPAYFYNFIEFAGRGTHRQVPGAERQSPLLVAEVVRDIKNQFEFSKMILTGHSQGGYMTHSTFMNYPELFDGAMPSAGGMVEVCRPDAYEDEALRAAQRKIPVALIHATNDEVILQKHALDAREWMKQAGFKQVRLFENDTAGHRFLLLPFDEALSWMEGILGITRR